MDDSPPDSPYTQEGRAVLVQASTRQASDVILVKGDVEHLTHIYKSTQGRASEDISRSLHGGSQPTPQLPGSQPTPQLPDLDEAVTLNVLSPSLLNGDERASSLGKRITPTLTHSQLVNTTAGGRMVNVTLSSGAQPTNSPQLENEKRKKGSFKLKVVKTPKPTQTVPEDISIEHEEELHATDDIDVPLHAVPLAEEPGGSRREEGESAMEEEEEEEEEDEDPFRRDGDWRGSFALSVQHRTETESNLPRSTRSRAVRALQSGRHLLLNKEETERGGPSCGQLCDISCCPCIKQPLEYPEELKSAQRAGFKMMPSFFFPAVPKLLEDVWVSIELFITIFDFIFSCVVFSRTPVCIFVVTLTGIGMVLALLDGFFYFTQAGSCVSCFRFFKKKLGKSQENGEREEEEEEKDKRPCLQFITPGQKKTLNTWFQLIRTVLSEAILYPLAVADLIEVIEGEVFGDTSAEGRITAGLFVVGIFYLVLSVYFMRIFMAISSVVNLLKLPKTTDNNYTTLLVKFCLVLMGQVLVQIMALTMIATKIRIEAQDCADSGELELHVSGFLWVVIVTGYILPFLGVPLFIVLNYGQLKLFSVGFYLDLTSTMISEGFADLVFQGEGVKTSKKKAEKALKKSDIADTRDKYNEYSKQFTPFKRILYRLTNPFALIGSSVYALLIAAFLVCHAFTQDPCNGQVKSALGQDAGVTATFVIASVIVLVTNYEAVGLACVILAIITLPLTAVILTPVLLIAALVFFTLRGQWRRRFTGNTT